MLYKELDATGQRVQRRGALILYLYLNWSEIKTSASSWARTLAYLGGAYLFLTNTSAFITLMFVYSLFKGR